MAAKGKRQADKLERRDDGDALRFVAKPTVEQIRNGSLNAQILANLAIPGGPSEKY
jgi:hypothetical protein